MGTGIAGRQRRTERRGEVMGEIWEKERHKIILTAIRKLH